MPGSLRFGRRMRCLRPPRSSRLRPANTRCFWRVEGFDFEQQETTLKLLAIAFGGDPACTDCNRVLRIPGFLNQQVLSRSPCHGRISLTIRVWTPADFQLDDSQRSMPCSCRFAISPAFSSQQRHSTPKSDWAWVCAELAHGKDAGKLTRELASRRADKPNPLYYAQRTVDVASARRWLLEGMRPSTT